MDGHATHEVPNQPGALHGIDLFSSDRPLTEAAAAFGAGCGGDAGVTVERAGIGTYT